jgi:glycosyltransferase involved in cell wall biosynthesis
MLGTPFAISAHAVDIWTSPAKELRAKVRDAEVVLCCYREAQEYLAGLAGSHTPVELAYHGVELPPEPVRRERTPPVLLSVGRLIEKKGFDTLLRAARLVADQQLDFRLAIAGDGPLWATLQRLVNELELGEYVRFLGPLNQRELERYFTEASAFVLPCQIAADGNRDGLPNTLLEAMARRLPVISTTLPSIREAIPDDRCGLLVAPQDPVALAEALVRVLEDQPLRARLGEAARQRAGEMFDRDLYAGRVFEVLAAAGMVARNGR